MMETLEDIKCAGCDEVINMEDDTYHYGNLVAGWLCDGCYESDLEHVSTIVELIPDDTIRKYYVGSYVSMDEYGDEWSGASSGYVKTDGWRGYNTLTIHGTVEVQEGADLWGERTSIRDIAELIERAHADGTLPVKVYVSICLTSNVFATLLGVHVDTEDESQFKEWLTNEIGE